MSAYTLWWFALGRLSSFDTMPETTLAIFNGDDFNSALSDLSSSSIVSYTSTTSSKKAITLIHFRDQDCRCRLINDEHFNRIVEKYSPQGINIITVNKHTLPQNSPLQYIPSSPAAAIVDTQGKLAYFGPYSLNALCNQEDGFVETTLNTLLAEQAVENIHTMGEGCFCPWRLQTHVQIQIRNHPILGKSYV